MRLAVVIPLTAESVYRGMRWIVKKYWHVQEGKEWNFRSQEIALWKHGQAHIQRHIKVKGTASPYDGKMAYWSQRLRTHPMFHGVKGALLCKQQGKCRWCGLLRIQMWLKSITLRQRCKVGEKNSGTNVFSTNIAMMTDTPGMPTVSLTKTISLRSRMKSSCPVLKPSRGGNSFA
jgi:hypothetical protein